MKREYAKYMSAVCIFLTKKVGKETFVLLQKRQNTSFANGWWEAGAAGHVDDGENVIEAAIHELSEELTIKVLPKDLIFSSVIHKYSPDKDSIAWYNFSLFCTKWSGEPKIGEPDKISEIKWFNIKKLPTKFIVDRKLMIKNYLTNNSFSLLGWKK